MPKGYRKPTENEYRSHEYVVAKMKDFGLTAKSVSQSTGISAGSVTQWSMKSRLPADVLHYLGVSLGSYEIKTSKQAFVLPLTLKGVPTKLFTVTGVALAPKERPPLVIPEDPPIEAEDIPHHLNRTLDAVHVLLKENSTLKEQILQKDIQIRELLDLLDVATEPKQEMPEKRLPDEDYNLPDLSITSVGTGAPLKSFPEFKKISVSGRSLRSYRNFSKDIQSRIISKLHEFDTHINPHDLRYVSGNQFFPKDPRDKCTYRVNKEIRLVFAKNSINSFELLEVIRRNDRRFYSDEK